MTPQDERLLKLWNEGLTAGAIGQRLAISTGTVYEKVAALRRAGHPAPFRSRKKGKEDRRCSD